MSTDARRLVHVLPVLPYEGEKRKNHADEMDDSDLSSVHSLQVAEKDYSCRRGGKVSEPGRQGARARCMRVGGWQEKEALSKLLRPTHPADSSQLAADSLRG